MKRTRQFEVPLSLLRKELAASDLLPNAYAHYRPLLADTLCFFLKRLSPVRLRHIFAQQLQLPASVSTAERVVALMSHSPVLHKLGQVVARDRRLNANFRNWLQKLESMAPQTALAEAQRLIESEFKDWRAASIEMASPLAEGSVAVIVPFICRDSPRGQRDGIFKVLKPAVCEKLEEDLEILSVLGGFLEGECERYHLPALDYRETFTRIRDLLLHEVRFEEEQQNLVEASKRYGCMPSVIIPKLLPFCTTKLTAMERIFGVPLPGNSLSDGAWRESLAYDVVQALIAGPLFASESTALFHADPHAGNLLITENRLVGIIDWSLVGRLTKSDRIDLMQVLLGAVAWDIQRIEEAVQRLSRRQLDGTGLKETLQVSVKELTWGTIPGISWLIRLLDKLALGAGLQPKSNLLMFRKALLTLSGVITDLTGIGECTEILDQVVIVGFLNHLVAEWPWRLQATFDDRSFRTHLSISDLASIAMSAPATLVRGWNQVASKMLAACRN